MSRFSALSDDEDEEIKSVVSEKTNISKKNDQYDDSKFYRSFNNPNRPYGTGYDKWHTVERNSKIGNSNHKKEIPVKFGREQSSLPILINRVVFTSGQKMDLSGNVRDSSGRIIMYTGRICARCYNRGHNSLHCTCNCDAFGNPI